jgi:hypothetical protein
MLWIGLLALCFAGDVVVDAEVPVEILVDGAPRAQTYGPAQVVLPVEAGERTLRVYVAGKPREIRLEVPQDGTTRVAVGRTGLSAERVASEDPADEAPVELRLVGDESLRVFLGEDRLSLAPGQQHRVDLARGEHPLQLRSADGLIVFATGTLDVRGTGPVVVQLSEGRAPEVIGDRTGSWRPAGN